MEDALKVMTEKKNSLGNENEKFHGLHCHFIVLIQGHGDHAILDQKLHKNKHQTVSMSVWMCISEREYFIDNSL